MTTKTHLATISVLLALTIAINLLISWVNNQAIDVGFEVPDGKLTSLSFAPFRDGQNPLKKDIPRPEDIAEDIQLLADKTFSIRTYSSIDGLEIIPQLARQHGLSVIQGAWLTYDKAVDPATLNETARTELLKARKSNADEIAALIKSANENPDVVKRVIVGNEVLLRGDMSPELLVDYIHQVKQAVKQPVSYADVWSFYLKHPEVAKEVDFITIHILPYWEDEPLEVNAAIGHIEKIYQHVQQQVQAMYPGKAILIGESGWPSHGKQRGWAIPSVVNEAKFVRGLIQVSKQNGFDLNIVEAFNQSWKSSLEGVVGANWGLFSADRKPVFPLTGKVMETPNWLIHCVLSSIILLALAGYFFRRLQALPTLSLSLFIVAAQILSSLLIMQALELWQTSFNNWQKLASVVLIGLNMALFCCLLQRMLDILSHQNGKTIIRLSLNYLYGFFVALALYKTSELALNGRYISYPIFETSLAVVGILALMASQYLANRTTDKTGLYNFNYLTGQINADNSLHKRISYALVILGLGLIIGETYAFVVSRDFIEDHPEFAERLQLSLTYTLENSQLLIWLSSLVILAIPLWLSPRNKQAL
ncbi:MAG: glycosyl hydrolase family 17 protein [Methylococcaceae bacterium]|jgi:exo-beta-1,3-glucanase (GH17 family)